MIFFWLMGLEQAFTGRGRARETHEKAIEITRSGITLGIF